MNKEMKDNVIFMAASLIDLADMTETDLCEVVEMVGVDAIRKLLDKDNLRYELNYEKMAEESCDYIEWEPMMTIPWRRDEDLSRLGLLIAETIDSNSPADEDAAERLFSFLSWDGILAWLSVNDSPGGLM